MASSLGAPPSRVKKQVRNLRGVPTQDLAVTYPIGYMVLLHVYKKQAQKAPAREVDLAERRMKEVLRGT